MALNLDCPFFLWDCEVGFFFLATPLETSRISLLVLVGRGVDAKISLIRLVLLNQRCAVYALQVIVNRAFQFIVPTGFSWDIFLW